MKKGASLFVILLEYTEKYKKEKQKNLCKRRKFIWNI